MSVPDHDAPERIEWQGDYVVAKTRGRWEYVTRPRNMRAAVILAIDAGDVILVEQYRVPMGRFSIEMPAGLVGDYESVAGEDTLAAAGRELIEETGYRAEELIDIGDFYSSPGMVSESFTMVLARGLTQVGEGGGTDMENIIVHRVPLTGIEAFLDEQRAQGKGIDVRLLMLLSPGLLARAQETAG